MRLTVDLRQARHIQMRVALGGRELGVPQQFLNRAEIRPCLQQMRRKRVAQRVRADPRLDRRMLHVLTHDPINAAGRQPGTAQAEEQRGPGGRSPNGPLPFALFLCLE